MIGSRTTTGEISDECPHPVLFEVLMGIQSTVQTTITVVLVLIALALVVGQILGQPLLIGYVETGSMEPTIEIGDGFVAIPTVLTADVGEGDVVTFDAQSVGGGGMTTHRVEEVTPEGYITSGDANSFTDQASGEPPVQDAQIVAVALEFDGDVVVLPSIGSGAELVQGTVGSVLGILGIGSITSYGIGTATTAVGVLLIAGSLIYGFFTAGKRPTDRSSDRTELVDSKWILFALVVVLLLPLMTSMVIASDTTTIQILSSQNPNDDVPTEIGVGETEIIDYSVENNLFVPKVVVLDSESAGVEFSESVVTVSHGEVRELDLRLSAPDDTGVYTRTRSEHHYYHLLPVPVIVGLHQIHPLLAMGAVSGVVVFPFVVGFLLFVGIRPISIRQVYD